MEHQVPTPTVDATMADNSTISAPPPGETSTSPAQTSAPTPASTSTALNPVREKRERGTISLVWNDFKKIHKNGKVFGKCNHCGTELHAPAGNGTSTLWKHLRRSCMKKKGNKDIRQQLLGIEAVNEDGTMKFGNFTFSNEVSREKLARMIALHDYPLNIVEQPGFREFMASVQPMFKNIGRTTMKNDVMKHYQKLKVNVAYALERTQSRIAITTDLWTSNQKKGYMAVTAHYIDDAWTLRKRLIRFAYVPTPHDAKTLRDALMDILLEWNIDRQLSAITVDNCSTNDSAICLVREALSESHSLLLDGRILHMRCCAHILNLIVQDGLEVIKDGIEKIRNSVVYWSASPSRVEKFEEAARQLRIPCAKKLCLDCKTRWNSTFFMLQTALEYKDVFPRLKQREKWRGLLPEEHEWKLARDICDKFKLFHSVTELFSGTKYPTSNLFFLKVCEIRTTLRKWKESLNNEIWLMANKMNEKFEKYWDICSLLLAVAVVLDPRYKLKVVEFMYPSMYKDQDEAINQIENVRRNVYELVNEYQVATLSPTSDKTSPLEDDPNKSSDIDSLVGFDTFITSTMSTHQVKSELDHYLGEPPHPRSSDFDILGWWKSNAARYPTIARVARDVLAIPLSTVASESAFSTCRRVLDDHRTRLKPETVEALMCTKDWIAMEKEGCSTSSSALPMSFNIDSD